jgi:hypothetical protein
MSRQDEDFLGDNTAVLGGTTKRTPCTYSCTIYCLKTASSFTVECQDKKKIVNWLKCVGKRFVDYPFLKVIQSEHKGFPGLQTFITRKLRGILKY